MLNETAAWFVNCSFLEWIGLIFLCYIGLQTLLKFIYIIRVYICSSPPNFSRYGVWSVVTGATDGIGKAIAFELASHKQNIILIARNQKKLEDVAAEIESKYGVETKYLLVDFSHDESIYQRIEDFLRGLDIGVLVNNVGVAHRPQPFLEIENLSFRLLQLTRVNMVSVLKMSEIVLPGMVKRGRGLVLNISSASALRPTCYFAAYGATKAFIDYFSRALSDELEDKGICIQSAIPFVVSTNINDHMPIDNIVVLSPSNYAKALMKTVGRESQTYGALQHAVQGFFTNHLPTWMFKRMMKKFAAMERARL